MAQGCPGPFFYRHSPEEKCRCSEAHRNREGYARDHGNAKGDGIIYPLEGELKGMGTFHGVPILEMSAKIVPGCSGGGSGSGKSGARR